MVEGVRGRGSGENKVPESHLWLLLTPDNIVVVLQVACWVMRGKRQKSTHLPIYTLQYGL